MQYPILPEHLKNCKQLRDRAAREAEGAAVTACYLRTFGNPPSPGTVEPVVDLSLSTEAKAQLIHDIATLVHIAVDPLLERGSGRWSEFPDRQVARLPDSDYSGARKPKKY